MKDEEKVICEHEWTECLVYHADGFCPSGPMCIRCGKYQRTERGLKNKVSTIEPTTCSHNWIMYEWNGQILGDSHREYQPNRVTKLLCTNCHEKKDV